MYHILFGDCWQFNIDRLSWTLDAVKELALIQIILLNNIHVCRIWILLNRNLQSNFTLIKSLEINFPIHGVRQNLCYLVIHVNFGFQNFGEVLLLGQLLKSFCGFINIHLRIDKIDVYTRELVLNDRLFRHLNLQRSSLFIFDD
jgi:hypothetical protein